MSDRKYRQHGYQDDDRDRRPREPDAPGADRRPPREPGAPAGTRRMSSEGAKNPRMMGYRSVAKCARCGAPVDGEIQSLSKCEKCGQALHACIQCVNFDPSARFECSEQIPARVSPKDAENECSLFTARTSWERETSSTPAPAAASSNGSTPESATSAKKAFDDLFNF
jgi:hypothetical protein